MCKANIPFTLAYLRNFLYEKYTNNTNMKIHILLAWHLHYLDTEAGFAMPISYDGCILL